MPENELKDHLIDKYRQLVADRYDYNLIKDSLPNHVGKEEVEALRYYFLHYLYPEPDARKELDEAFSYLEGYVTQPKKVWGILGNIAGAIFRFGSMLIDALKAGLVSLDAHVAAKRFEEDLYMAALRGGYDIPLSDEQFRDCMRNIDRRRVERFIDDVGKLFTSMSNTKLLGKTIEIMNDVVAKMESRKRIYTTEEVEGIKLGITILEKGYELFKDFPETTKKAVVAFIVEKEHRFTEELYQEEA